MRKPWLFLIRRVMGDSMVPTLVPGMAVLGIRPRTVKPGDIVIIRHDGLDKIKRVKDTRHGKIFVLGDNKAQSSDSREWGWLSAELVLAKVVFPRKAARVELTTSGVGDVATS